MHGNVDAAWTCTCTTDKYLQNGLGHGHRHEYIDYNWGPAHYKKFVITLHHYIDIVIENNYELSQNYKIS
jgi:hypothetical protein